MVAQASSRGITDAEFSEQSRIVQSAPDEIALRFGRVIELLLIEDGSVLEHGGRLISR
jgi:hypothetical protein